MGIISALLMPCILISVIIMIFLARKNEIVKKFVILIPILYLALLILHSTCFLSLLPHCRHCTIDSPDNPIWYKWFDANELKNILLIVLAIVSGIKIFTLSKENLENKSLTLTAAIVFVVAATLSLFMCNFA